MKLTGELKEKVAQAETKEETKKVIEEAGMILDDAELDQVAGGVTKEESDRAGEEIRRLKEEYNARKTGGRYRC